MQDEAAFVTPIVNKKISALNKPISSVKRTSSFAFADSPFVVPPSPMMKRLGFGTQVTVYRYKRQKLSGDVASPWAIKKGKLGRTRSQVMQRLTTEGEILRQLDHPNIVKFKKLTKTNEGDVCLSMEAFGKGLDDLICKRQETGELFRSKHIMKVAWSLANALDYLHNTIHLLHGDIKSGNVLVKGNFEEVKLCDFGVSIFLKDDLSGPKNPTDSYTGSEPWLSKEILNGNVITDKADVFAYGLVIWEMIALDVPHVALISNTNTDDGESFDGSFNNADTGNDTISEEYFEALGTRPPLPDFEYPAEYNQLIGLFFCCTCEDYTKRPNAEKIIDSFSEYDVQKEQETKQNASSKQDDQKAEENGSSKENEQKGESIETSNGEHQNGGVECSKEGQDVERNGSSNRKNREPDTSVKHVNGKLDI